MKARSKPSQPLPQFIQPNSATAAVRRSSYPGRNNNKKIVRPSTSGPRRVVAGNLCIPRTPKGGWWALEENPPPRDRGGPPLGTRLSTWSPGLVGHRLHPPESRSVLFPPHMRRCRRSVCLHVSRSIPKKAEEFMFPSEALNRPELTADPARGLLRTGPSKPAATPPSLIEESITSQEPQDPHVGLKASATFFDPPNNGQYSVRAGSDPGFPELKDPRLETESAASRDAADFLCARVRVFFRPSHVECRFQSSRPPILLRRNTSKVGVGPWPGFVSAPWHSARVGPLPCLGLPGLAAGEPGSWRGLPLEFRQRLRGGILTKHPARTNRLSGASLGPCRPRPGPTHDDDAGGLFC